MNNKSLAIRTTIVYLAFGIVWIYLSDLFLLSYFFEDNTETYIQFQGYKGFFYVGFTSILLLILLLNFSKKIHASEKRIKKAAKIGKISFWTYYKNNDIFEFSSQFKKIIENPSFKKQIHFDDLIKIIHIEDLDLVKNTFNNHTLEQKISLKFRIYTAKENVKWIHFIGEVIQEYNKGEIQFAGTAQDITEEETLKNLLKATNKLAKIGNWEVDIRKKSTYWSDITKQIHEVDPSFEPNLENAINFYKPGHNRDILRETVENSFESGAEWDLELELITAKNKTIWVRTIGQTELDHSGKPTRIFGNIQDITQRKVNEQDLKKFKKIVSNTKDGVAIGDFKGNPTFLNNSLTEKIGYTREEIIELGGPEMLYIDKELGKHILEELISGNYWTGEVDMKAKSGKIINFFLSTGPIFNENNELVSIFGIFTDITYRIESEKSLLELNKNLEKSLKDLESVNQELEQFAFIASHDLQEPLRMVTSFLKMLSKKYYNEIDDKGKKYIQFATEGAERMRQIILDLLEYSRAGNIETAKEAVDLNIALEDYKILRRSILEEKSISIHSSKMPTIKWYKAPLIQTFHALMDNAVKYSSPDEKPTITIDIKDNTKFCEISIHDNGIGIQEDYLDKIFIMFQRLHTRDTYEGSGMGLALVKKNVEGWGGQISVKSEIGKGSVFTFTIPKIVK